MTYIYDYFLLAFLFIDLHDLFVPGFSIQDTRQVGDEAPEKSLKSILKLCYINGVNVTF